MSNPVAPYTNRPVQAFLDRLEREHFYGIIAVRYENGKAVHIRREESILPAHLMENPGNHESDS
jgi:hypothetical protein